MSEIKGVTWDFGGRQLSIKSALALASLRFPDDELVTCVSVMTAESQRWTKAWHKNHEHIPGSMEHVLDNEFGDPVTLSTDLGLMQINVPGAEPLDNMLYDPKKNLKRAKLLWEARGWQPWAAYNSNRYLAFFDEVEDKFNKGGWRLMVPVWKAR